MNSFCSRMQPKPMIIRAHHLIREIILVNRDKIGVIIGFIGIEIFVSRISRTLKPLFVIRWYRPIPTKEAFQVWKTS